MAGVALKFGPADHGRPVTADELAEAEYAGGFEYEVIDGWLFVSPAPNPAEMRLNTWLYNALHRLVGPSGPLNLVTGRARVYVPDRPDLTVPEPDLAGYTDWPLDLPFEDVRWEEVSPLVVAEVLVAGDARKDLERNVDLYLQVPSISEYWVLDGREVAAEPIFHAHRRYRGRWSVSEVLYGETYTTKLLPGFSLLIDPRK